MGKLFIPLGPGECVTFFFFFWPRSKVVIGDVNAVGGEAVANIIRKEGGYVCCYLLSDQ
jgi:hypothetical protein